VRPGIWPNARNPRCVRVGDTKLVVAEELGLEQLYDLAADPGERRDLLREARLAGGALAPELAARRAELEAALAAWQAGARPLPSRYDRSQLREIDARLRNLGYTGIGDDE
jgi:hypothetical protein